MNCGGRTAEVSKRNIPEYMHIILLIRKKIKRRIKKFRKKIKYSEWYQEIFCRKNDKFKRKVKIKSGGICGLCGRKLKVGEFEVHHIWPRRNYPHLGRKDWNGVCLHTHCHKFADEMNNLQEIK